MTPSKQTWGPLRLRAGTISNNLPLDNIPEFTTLIGSIIERWTVVEDELTKTLEHLLDGNSVAANAILYSLNSTSMRITVVRALARAVVPDGPELRGLLYLLDAINDLSKERNDYVHGQFWQTAEFDKVSLVLIRPTAAKPLNVERIGKERLERHRTQVELRINQLSFANSSYPELNTRLLEPPAEYSPPPPQKKRRE